MNSFKVELIDQIDDPENDNVDVRVELPDGRRYVATVFTLKNIESIMDRAVTSGDFSGGKYFWNTNSFIVRRLSLDAIEAAVQDMMEFEALSKVFEEADDADDDDDDL